MVPTCGLKDHVTAVLEVPVTVDLNVALWPPVSDALPGDKLTPTVWVEVGFRTMLAVAVLVGSATLVTLIVTVWELLMVVGAV